MARLPTIYPTQSFHSHPSEFSSRDYYHTLVSICKRCLLPDLRYPGSTIPGLIWIYTLLKGLAAASSCPSVPVLKWYRGKIAKDMALIECRVHRDTLLPRSPAFNTSSWVLIKLQIPKVPRVVVPKVHKKCTKTCIQIGPIHNNWQRSRGTIPRIIINPKPPPLWLSSSDAGELLRGYVFAELQHWRGLRGCFVGA